jgi:TonB family protein
MLLWVLSGPRVAEQNRPTATAPIVARLVAPSPMPVADQAFLTEQAEPKPRAVAPFVPKQQPRVRFEPRVPVKPEVVVRNSTTATTIEQAQAPDAGTLAQYRITVLGAARRFKQYPDIAIENNWHGKVEVRMMIDSSGEISAMDVRTSAGHAVLDRHALEIIERAKATAPIPPALRGREFIVDIPVEFLLREPGA